MGLLTDALTVFRSERKLAAAATMPTWTYGTPQYPREPLYRLAGAYTSNEIVYACVEELASSAAEPGIAAYRKGTVEPEKLTDHPVLSLFERPNPFCDKYALVAGIIMFLQLSGNVFIEKVRSAAGGVVELWLLRPDRIRVIPDRTKFVSGYLYELGDQQTVIPASDVIHIRTRNPNPADHGADFYGMPPLMACLPRVESDLAMRSFVNAFFRNAGVPAGLLTLQRAVGASERDLIRNRFRGETGGMNSHSLMIIDGTDASYTPMSMPLGERGLVVPELDEIAESRIASVFGVPLELIGARLGMIHGNRSTMREARAGFWDETLAPMYVMLASALTNGLVDDFTGFDYLEFDTGTVKALAEDENALAERVRENMLAGVITREEARVKLGFEPEPDQSDTWVLGPRITEMAVDAPPPAPVEATTGALNSPATTVTSGAGAAPATNGAVHA